MKFFTDPSDQRERVLAGGAGKRSRPGGKKRTQRRGERGELVEMQSEITGTVVDTATVIHRRLGPGRIVRTPRPLRLEREIPCVSRLGV